MWIFSIVLGRGLVGVRIASLVLMWLVEMFSVGLVRKSGGVGGAALVVVRLSIL